MDRKKRVLAIIKSHQNDGETTRLYRLIRFLLHIGYEVHYLAAGELQLAKQENLVPHLIRIPLPRLGERWQWLMFSLLAQFNAVLILLKNRFRAVIAFGSLFGGIAVIPCLLSWTKLYVFLRSTPWRLGARSRQGTIGKLISNANDLIVMTLASKVIVAAETIKEEIASAYPWVKKSLVAIPYGVVLGKHFFSSSDGSAASLEAIDQILGEKRKSKKSLRGSFVLPEDPIVVVVAGVLNRGKNVEVVIRALNASENDRIVVLICGSGPEKIKLKSITAGFGLSNQVIFTGWIENPIELISECDLFILPSLDETLSNSIFEALGEGVAVMASDTPLYRELLQSNEMLFDPQNIGQLADKFNELGNENRALARLREVSHRRAQALASEWGAEVLSLLEQGNAK